MTPYTVLVDMDAIVADLATDWYGLYNKRFKKPDQKPVCVEDVHVWDVGAAINDKRIYGLLHEPGLYLNLKPMPGSQYALEQISQMKWKDGTPMFKVFFLTASITAPHILADKATWAAKHFGKIVPPKQLIFAYHKELVRGEYFIDDSPKNLLNMAKANPNTSLITIDYPYNRRGDVDEVLSLRAMGYSNPGKAWLEIRDYFEAINETLKGVTEASSPQV